MTVVLQRLIRDCIFCRQLYTIDVQILSSDFLLRNGRKKKWNTEEERKKKRRKETKNGDRKEHREKDEERQRNTKGKCLSIFDLENDCFSLHLPERFVQE